MMILNSNMFVIGEGLFNSMTEMQPWLSSKSLEIIMALEDEYQI